MDKQAENSYLAAMPTISALHTSHGSVAVHKSGQGKRLLIALHGFGQDGHVFDGVLPPLDHGCTLYAIDLPFHGDTHWKRSEFRPAHLQALINQILKQENCLRFEAVGHSLGGRLWISMLPCFAGRMNALYLIAPDGFYMPWSGFTEGTPGVLRRLAAQLVRKPERLFRLAEWLYERGWLDNFALRYLKHNLEGEATRRRLMATWYSLRHFPLDRRRAVEMLQQSNVPTLLLLGQQDRIVPPTRVQPYVEELPNVLVKEEKGTHLGVLCHCAAYLQDGLIRYWQWLRMK